jgi:hypothetical protein
LNVFRQLKPQLFVVRDRLDRKNECAIFLKGLFVQIGQPNEVTFKHMFFEILTEKAHAFHVDNFNSQGEEVACDWYVKTLIELKLCIHDASRI